ncbi:MAG: ABC transporter ATP-binding protein [Thermodesulfobacteriota bacterium]|nr:ABC transporter ATP-binding protein [Thermodesulfobacteriota bacterium]
MTPEYAALLENVSFSYKNRKILENITLKIPMGDFATIVGPNGGGKTTLLQLLLGLLKPDSGRIELLGQPPEKSRLNIGYMPQYVKLDMQFPVSVMDVVLMGRLSSQLWGRYSRQDRNAAEDALNEVRISDYKSRNFNELSGGQKQRVLIARALCSRPKVLILDEPTSNIDEETKHIFFEILEKLNARMTILLVSHDLGFVSQKVKSVICVNREVVMHPTTKMNGTIIKEIYGGEFEMIRHDHRFSEKGYFHE